MNTANTAFDDEELDNVVRSLCRRTTARTPPQVIDLALRCLAEEVLPAYTSGCRPALQEPGTEARYALALNALQGAERSADTASEPKSIGLLPEQARYVEQLLSRGAGPDVRAVLRLAVGVFFHIVTRLEQGWHLVWESSVGEVQIRDLSWAVRSHELEIDALKVGNLGSEMCRTTVSAATEEHSMVPRDQGTQSIHPSVSVSSEGCSRQRPGDYHRDLGQEPEAGAES